MFKCTVLTVVCGMVIATVGQAPPRQVRIRGGHPNQAMRHVTAKPGETVTFEAWVYQRNPNKKSPQKWIPLPNVTIYWEVRDVKGVTPKVVSWSKGRRTDANGYVTKTYTIPKSAKPCKGKARYVAQFNAVPGVLRQARNNGKLTVK